jgi:CubicO group peptidase (beta-lactamase class C family)
MTSLETDIERLIAKASVPGVGLAIIREGRLDHYVSRGLRDSRAAECVDEHTVFEAASLSKPVFAFAVLQLADSNLLSLQVLTCPDSSIHA